MSVQLLEPASADLPDDWDLDISIVEIPGSMNCTMRLFRSDLSTAILAKDPGAAGGEFDAAAEASPAGHYAETAAEPGRLEGR